MDTKREDVDMPDRLSEIDTGLSKAFEALIEERNVSHAAERLSIRSRLFLDD